MQGILYSCDVSVHPYSVCYLMQILACRSLECWTDDNINFIGSFSGGHEFGSKKLYGKMSETISMKLLIEWFEVYDNWNLPILLLFALMSFSIFKFINSGSLWDVIEEEKSSSLESRIRGESLWDSMKAKGTFEEKSTFCFCGDSALKI